MIILRLSEIGLSSTFKGLGPDVSVGTPTPGGQKGGPGGQPKPGHKYVHREWTGDHWEYEYAQEPHPERHGMGHVGAEEGHSIELPDHVDSGTMSAEEAYSQGRQHKLITPGMVYDAVHPKTGEPIKIEVVKPPKPFEEWTDRAKKEYPHGVKIMIRSVPTAEEGKRPKKGERLNYKGAGSWAAIENWMRDAKYREAVLDPETGEHIYTVRRNVGSPNNETDKLRPPKKGLPFQIVFEKGSPEWESKEEFKARGGKRKGGAANFREFKNEEDLKAGLELLQNNRRLINATESGEIPSLTEQLKTKSPLEILMEGSLPKERRQDKRNIQTKFDSPEQRQQFMNSLAAEVVVPASLAAERMFKVDFMESLRGDQLANEFIGINVDVGHDQIKQMIEDGSIKQLQFNVLPGSPLDKFLGDAANGSYKPDRGSLAGYAMRTIPRRNLDWAKAKNVASQSQLAHLEGQADSIAESKQAIAAYNMEGDAPTVFATGGGVSEAEETEQAQLNQKIDSWRGEQLQKLDKYIEATNDPVLGEKIGQLRTSINKVGNAKQVEDLVRDIRSHAASWPESDRALFEQFAVADFVNKAIKSLTAIFVEHIAMKAIQQDLRTQIMKAKATQPNPEHEYSHREGMDDDPSYMYRDPVGNMVRYTNAPEGSADYSPFGGAPRVHASEPSMDMAPEYFTPDGRKLTRAPHPAAQVQWNPNYHSNDPANLWAGRWVNPLTGEHEHTYVDSDMRGHEKFRIHHQNRLIDVRLPHLRRYVSELLHSDQPKDNVIGLMMAMVDQGRVHPVELSKLLSGDIQMHGDVVRFGRFAVHAGEKIQQIIRRMMGVRTPADPFFSVPVMKNDPNSIIGIDTDFRVIGPHYIARILARLGTPLGALMSYHATQTYSMQIQRCIRGTNVSLQCGHEFALLEVARRMGHDFENEPDVNPVIKQVLETMIDPVVVEVIQQNARASGDDQGEDNMTRQVVLAVPHVSANNNGHTHAEKEFGKWVHSYPYHEHAEAKRMYEAA